MSELFSLCVYIVQQLGIVLAVGAETVLLAAYLLNIHSDKDEHGPLMHASKYVLGLGLMAIAASGTGAVAYHLLLQQYDVLLSAAFIFKWILILAAAGAYIWDDTLSNHPPLAQASARGLAGALWYGMLLVHLVAPVIEWMPLLLLFISWTIAFIALWGIFVAVMHWSAPRARVARKERAKVKAEQRAATATHIQEEHAVAEAKAKQQELDQQAKAVAAKQEQEKKQRQEQSKAEEAAAAAAKVAAEQAKRAAEEQAKLKAEEEAKKAASAPLPAIAPLELVAPPVVVEPPLPPPPPPKPVAPPPPPPAPSPKPAPPAAAPPPAVSASGIPGAPEATSLQTIRVMPRTVEDLSKHP